MYAASRFSYRVEQICAFLHDVEESEIAKWPGKSLGKKPFNLPILGLLCTKICLAAGLLPDQLGTYSTPQTIQLDCL